jgi:hypothetical protein
MEPKDKMTKSGREMRKRAVQRRADREADKHFLTDPFGYAAVEKSMTGYV